MSDEKSLILFNCCPFRITPGDEGGPKSPGKEGMPTITEQDEEHGEGIACREEAMTPDKERPQEQWAEKHKVAAGSIPVVEPLLGEQDQPGDEDGE